jgi:hypothetical protein
MDRCPTCGRRKRRSIPQNKLYWELVGKCVPFVYNGRRWSKKEWHEYFKDMFIVPEVVSLPDGRSKLCDPSSAESDVAEFSVFYAKVEAWCSERGVYLEEMPA